MTKAEHQFQIWWKEMTTTYIPEPDSIKSGVAKLSYLEGFKAGQEWADISFRAMSGL